MCVLVLCCLFCFKQKTKYRTQNHELREEIKSSFFSRISQLISYSTTYTHTTHTAKGLIRIWQHVLYIYIYTYHKMTTCVRTDIAPHVIRENQFGKLAALKTTCQNNIAIRRKFVSQNMEVSGGSHLNPFSTSQMGARSSPIRLHPTYL